MPLCAVQATGNCTSNECLVLGSCAQAVDFRADGTDKKLHVRSDSQQRCLDVDVGGRSTSAAVADSGDALAYPLELSKCNGAFKGGINQQFDYDEATGILSPLMFGSEISCVVVCE